MPDVVVRPRPDVADPERQAGLGALQGLALRFLIAAQDQRFLWWVEIEADHLPELRLKLLILGQFEGPREMRLNVVAAHRRCTLACEIPAARAIVRQLQRACIAGGV